VKTLFEVLVIEAYRRRVRADQVADDMLRGVVKEAGQTPREMSERDVITAISEFAPLWEELFPAEQARIVRRLVERVDLTPDGMQVRLRAEGLQTLVAELQRRRAA
jgi:hypothetical protein